MDLLEDHRYTNQKKQAHYELEKLLPSTPPRVREAIFPHIGRRRPRALLGRGSHGRVWQVSIPSGAQGAIHGDINLPPAVAVKELGMETKELEATAKRELAVLRALCSSSSCKCTSLVHCWGATIDPARNIVAVALELATEGSLRSWLNRWKEEQQQQHQQQGLTGPDASSCKVGFSAAPSLTGDLSVVAALAAHLVSGLKVLHAAGFCHGDLTPDNVLVLPWVPSAETFYSTTSLSLSSASKVASTSLAVPQPLPRPISVEVLPGGPWRFVLSDFGLAAPTITMTNTHSENNTNTTLKIGGTLQSSSAMENTDSSISGGSSGSTTITTPPPGMAAAVSPSPARVPCGASHYCCPEAHASGYSGACPGDMWSLGVVLWEAGAFCHPFDLDERPYNNENSFNNTKAALATAAPPTPNAAPDSTSASGCLVPATTATLTPPLPPVHADTTIDCGDQNPFAGEYMSSPSKHCSSLATNDNYWAISEAIEAISAKSQRNLDVVVAARHLRKDAMVQEKSDLSRVSSQANGAGLPTASEVNVKGGGNEKNEMEFWEFVASCLALKAEQRPTAESAASTPFVSLGCDEVL